MNNNNFVMKFHLRLGEDGKVYISKDQAKKLIDEGYGFLNGENLELDYFETLYLLFKNLADLSYKEKRISFDEALKIFISRDNRALEKFIVYMKLREKNYIVRRGYGGNYDFLLYERGDSYKESSASYIVSILHEGESIEMKKLDEILSFALKMRKTMLFAVLDSNSDVSFYEASRIRL